MSRLVGDAMIGRCRHIEYKTIFKVDVELDISMLDDAHLLCPCDTGFMLAARCMTASLIERFPRVVYARRLFLATICWPLPLHDLLPKFLLPGDNRSSFICSLYRWYRRFR